MPLFITSTAKSHIALRDIREVVIVVPMPIHIP